MNPKGVNRLRRVDLDGFQEKILIFGTLGKGRKRGPEAQRASM